MTSLRARSGTDIVQLLAPVIGSEVRVNFHVRGRTARGCWTGNDYRKRQKRG